MSWIFTHEEDEQKHYINIETGEKRMIYLGRVFVYDPVDQRYNELEAAARQTAAVLHRLLEPYRQTAYHADGSGDDYYLVPVSVIEAERKRLAGDKPMA